MASKYFSFEDASSATRNLEFRLPNNAHVFDFDDDTFKASGHTTAALAMTESSLGGGQSLYAVSFDVDRLGITTSQPNVLWRVVDGSGNGVSEWENEPILEVTVTPPIVLRITPNFRGDLGDDLDVCLSATQDGRPYTLSSANSPIINIRELGGTTNAVANGDFLVAGASAYNNGQYEVRATTPSFVAGRVYVATAQITVGSDTISTIEEFTTVS